MEATENREGMEVLPDQEEENSTSSAMLSDKLTEAKDGDSKEENDGEQPDRALERGELTRKPVHALDCYQCLTMVKNIPVHQGKVFKLNQPQQWTQR